MLWRSKIVGRRERNVFERILLSPFLLCCNTTAAAAAAAAAAIVVCPFIRRTSIRSHRGTIASLQDTAATTLARGARSPRGEQCFDALRALPSLGSLVALSAAADAAAGVSAALGSATATSRAAGGVCRNGRSVPHVHLERLSTALPRPLAHALPCSLCLVLLLLPLRRLLVVWQLLFGFVHLHPLDSMIAPREALNPPSDHPHHGHVLRVRLPHALGDRPKLSLHGRVYGVVGRAVWSITAAAMMVAAVLAAAAASVAVAVAAIMLAAAAASVAVAAMVLAAAAAAAAA